MENLGLNKSVSEQSKILRNILEKDQELFTIIRQTAEFKLPNYYIGGGAICQSVWNTLFSKPVGYGISDIDIVYFDKDLSERKEAAQSDQLRKFFEESGYEIDVKNEARVHLWYETHFGYPIEAYQSTEEAISTWPTTASSIGVFLDGDDNLQIFAPYGMNEMFAGIVKANKVLITEEVFRNKAKKWQNKWSDLKIIEW